MSQYDSEELDQIQAACSHAYAHWDIDDDGWHLKLCSECGKTLESHTLVRDDERETQP